MNENENVQNVNETPEESGEQLADLLQIRRDKLSALVEAGKNPFEKVKFDFDTYTVDIKERFEELEGKTVKIAGRIMSRRAPLRDSFQRAGRGSAPPHLS